MFRFKFKYILIIKSSMLLSSLFCLLLSNALSFRRDTTILYARTGIIILFYCIYLSYNNLFISYLDTAKFFKNCNFVNNKLCKLIYSLDTSFLG